VLVERTLQIILLAIGVGGAIVGAVTLQDAIWRMAAIAAFGLMGFIGLILIVATYRKRNRQGDHVDWLTIDEAQEWLRTLLRQHGLTDEQKLASAPMATIQMAINAGRLNYKGPSKSELTHVNRSELLHDYPDKEHSMLYDSFAGTYLYPKAGTPQTIQMFSSKRTLFKDSTIAGGIHMDKTEDTTFDHTNIKK
jgi:hypothetical protein